MKNNHADFFFPSLKNHGAKGVVSEVFSYNVEENEQYWS